MIAPIGAILAGGASRRFGSDKALAEMRGMPMIDHAARALSRHVDRVVVIGRDHPGLAGAPDRPQPGLGPLGGIAGALGYAADLGEPSVLTVACDVPFPPESLFEALRRPPCWCEDHPVFGHWPVSLMPELDAWLEKQADRSVRGFARATGTIPVRVADPITDVDTPEDLDRIA